MPPTAAEKYTQDNRPIAVSTPLGKDVLLLEEATGTEKLSGLFAFELSMLALAETDVDFRRIVGQAVTVTVRSGGGKLGPRYFNGFVRRFRQGERVVGANGYSEFVRYRAEVVPKVWLLTRNAQSRIFQQLTVPDILKQVFAGYDVAYQLNGDYKPRDYCTQYRETDFDFASRLMEEEGIYYFFKHGEGAHQMVLADTPQGHPDLAGGADVNYHVLGAASGQSVDDGERVFDLLKTQEVRSGKETLWDYSFEMPTTRLQATQAIVPAVAVGTVSHGLDAGGNGSLEAYDYPGRFAQRFDGVTPGGGDRAADLQKISPDGERTVKVRMQEETWPALTLDGESDCRQLSAGHAFRLQKHPTADDKYVLIAVEHSASIEGSYVSGQARPLSYRNRFQCLPAALPFRPPRLTPRARVAGAQTAVVVGPAGEEIFTDKYGRVKVQFRWDRHGKNDADSSCWVRVGTPWAGKQWGAIHVPRVGQEVLVAFEEGDPDTPIIIGSVYNAADMPPYTLPDNKTQSGVKSRSTLGGSGEQFNELRFEDKKDSEQVYFHAQKDFVRVVENNDSLEVGYEEHDGSHKSPDGSQTVKIYKDRTETIETGNETITIKKGNRTETLKEGDEAVTLEKGSRTHKIKANDTLQVEGDNTITITGNQTLTIKQGNRETKIELGNDTTTLSTGNRATKIEVGNDSTKLSAGASTTEAMQSIVLKVGANSITVDQTGITLKGIMIKLDGEMMVTVKGGMMVQVNAGGMLILKGGITMINEGARMAGAWVRVAAKTAAEAGRAATLGDEARALLRDGLTPADYLALLEKHGQYPDGVRFLACALPKREALWWACQCLRQAPDDRAGQAAALEAVERFVRRPTDTNRRAALAASEAAGPDTPAGCAALAAFVSAGSLGPADQPPVPPAEHLTALGVANAVVLAAVAPKPQEAPQKFAHFLALGRAVAEGNSRWPDAE